MLRINEPDISKKEFEAVKGLAKEGFNDYFMLMEMMSILSLLVLATCISGESEPITFAAATLVMLSGTFFIFWILSQLGLIYPRRFKILYKRKKH